MWNVDTARSEGAVMAAHARESMYIEMLDVYVCYD